MPAVAGGTQQSTQQTTDEFDPLEVAAARDDQYVNPLSLFVEATQALNWQREMLRDTVLKQGTYMMTGQADQPLYEEAQKRVYQQLSWLTYTRTFYAAKALMSYDRWNRGVGFKLNVKSKIPYPPKKYLMTISTERRGQPVEWMMDLQGTDLFGDELEDERSVKLLLKHIQERVKQFAALKRIRSIRESNGDYMVFAVPKPPVEEMTDYTVQRSEDAVALLEAIIGNGQAGNIENTIHTQRLGLGFLPLKGEIHPPDNDADVTYNPDRRFKYTKSVQTEGSGNISVQVTKNFSARRQWGTFFNMENHKTIDFINNMMPRIGSAWFEILLQQGENNRLHLKLTPWGEPKTTFVQPFRISVKDCPMSLPYATTDIIAGKSFDFRVQDMENILVQRLPPYLISGKGNEIDGMVHSIMAFDEKTREKAREVCNHILDTELQKPDDQNKTSNIIERMRAYYSTDSNGPSGSLCPFGERSIFFFNVQGEIAGVEMSSPSIRVVNQFVPQDYPKVLPRKRDASSESRGEDREEREGGRGNRFERNWRSRSMTRAPNVMPPPPPAGYVHHVPDAIMDEMRETRSLVQDLVRALHAGHGQAQAPAQSGPNTEEIMQLVQKKMSEMEEQMRKRKADESDSSDDEERVATRSSSKKEEFAVDPTDGWEACVTDKTPDRCPITISVSGIPVFPQRLNEKTDTLELVGDDKPLLFKLDRDCTTREGAIIYKYEQDGNVIVLYPQPQIMRGEINDIYFWQIRYSNAEGSSVMNKICDSNILVKQYRNEKIWAMNKDLQKQLNTKQRNFKVKITIPTEIEMVTRNEAWKRRQNKERIGIRKNRDNNTFETNNIKNEYTLDESTLTLGCGGDRYLAKMFKDFGRMPFNDRSGLLPVQIRLIIEDSWCYVEGSQEKKTMDLTVELDLIDSKIPLYSGYHEHNGENYNIQIMPFYSIERKGYTWGIRTDLGQDQDPEFCAYIAFENHQRNEAGQTVKKADFPHELFNDLHPERWMFDFMWDTGEPVRSAYAQVIVEYNENGFRERTPYIQNKNQTPEQAMELNSGVFKALRSDVLAIRYKSTEPVKIKAVAEYLRMMETADRMPRFGLFVFHRAFPPFINHKIFGRKIQSDSVPKKIKLNHTFLNGDEASKKGKHYPEADYILYLVDLQGPVWVSENGTYMVSPYADSKKNYKTWALWRWDEKKAAYIIFAEKSHQGEAKNKHLINDQEFDFDSKNEIVSMWTFYGQWDGSHKSAEQMKKQKFTDMRVTIVHDPRPTAVKYKDKSGKEHLQNPYHLYQRMPDFSVEKTAEDVWRIQQGRMFEAVKAAKRETARTEAARSKQSMKCAFDRQPDDDDVFFGLAGKDDAIIQGQDASKAKQHLVVAQGTKQAAVKKQQETLIEQKEAESAAVVQKQDLPTKDAFDSTLQDTIETVTRRVNRNKKKDATQGEVVRAMPEKTPEEREAKRRATKQLQARDKISKKILITVQDFAKLTFVIKTFIQEYDQTKIPAMRAQLKEIAIEEAKTQKETYLDLYPSDEDKIEFDKTLKGVIELCVEEALLRTFEAMKLFRKQEEEKEKRESIAKINREAAQRAMAEREAKDKARHEALLNRAKEDPNADITWEDTQGVEDTGDVTKDINDFAPDDGDSALREAEAKAIEEEPDYTKHESIVLADPLISEVTPWTEIMDMYRSYLLREKAMTDEKTRLYKERVERTNTAQRELKKKQEEEEKEEDRRRSEEKERLQKAKFSIEREFEKKRALQTPQPNTGGYNVLQQCRVYEDENSDLVPYSIKARLKFGPENETLDCEFFVQNPFSMRYDCHDLSLRLQPESINLQIDGVQAYAWKLYLISSSGTSTDEVELAVKWNKPNILMLNNEISVEKTTELDWRSRVDSLKNILVYRKKKGGTWDQLKKKVEESCSNELVWYREMTFEKTKKDFKGEILPLISLMMPRYRGSRERLYNYNEAEIEEIIRASLTKVWNQDVLRNNIMKMFEFPTVLFLTMKIEKKESTNAFLMQKPYVDELNGEVFNRWMWKARGGLEFTVTTAKSIPDSSGKKIGSWLMTVSGKDKTTGKEHEHIRLYLKVKTYLLDTDTRWVVSKTEDALEESQQRVFDEALKILPLDDENGKTVHITTENIHKLTERVNGRNVEFVSNLKVQTQIGTSQMDEKRTKIRVKYIESEANEFDVGHYTNKMMLMSKIVADFTRSTDPAEISEECEGGLASPRTGARRALGSRAGPPAAVQLLPLQSRKQALQERKRLSVTAPPPRSLPVLSRRLHGH